MPSNTPLTAVSTIGDWLDSATGGDLLRRLITQVGLAEENLEPVRGLPLKQLAIISRGRLPQVVIDDLVVRANRDTSRVAPVADAPTQMAPRSAPRPAPTPTPTPTPPAEPETQVALPSAPEPLIHRFEGSPAPAAEPRWHEPQGQEPQDQEPLAPFIEDRQEPRPREQTTPDRFTGRTVIVTGAATGVGRAIASRVAREGGHVIAVDLLGEQVRDLVASMPGTWITPVAADMTGEEAVQRIMTATGGRVDALANVAAAGDEPSSLHEIDDAIWDRVIGANLTGAFRLMRAAIPFMLRAGGGAIVNVFSEAGMRQNVYSAANHALVGLTRSAASTYGPQGLRINAVVAGNGGMSTGVSGASSWQSADPVDDAAGPVTFLLSDDGMNLNGAVLLSGGALSV